MFFVIYIYKFFKLMKKEKTLYHNCMSIVWNGCTIYAVAFYENSVGLSVNFEFPCTGPQTGVTLYLIQEELNLKEDDKILEDENYNIYILHSNGEKKFKMCSFMSVSF